MSDPLIAKSTDQADGLNPAAGSSSELSKVLLAIQSLKASTDAKLGSLTDRIKDLEDDLANSETHSNPAKIVPVTSSPLTPVTPTTTPTSGFHQLFTQQTVAFTATTPTFLDAKPSHSRKHPTSNDEDDDTLGPPKPKKPKVKHSKTKSSKKPVYTSESDDDTDADNSTDPQKAVVDQQMLELMQEYESSKPKYMEDPTTTDIQDPLASLLETWFWNIYAKDEVKTELAKPLQPGNANALIPTRINEAVFRSLNPAALTKDLPCRFIHNAFMKASQPFAIVCSTLIALENHLKATNTPLQVDCNPGLTIDFMSLRKQMDQGLRLLGIANSQMVVHRKDILSKFLNKDFKKLCKPHVPFDQWMFSTNLKTLLEDTIRINRMVQQNKPTPPPQNKPVFSRGRGGPQGSRRGFQGRYPNQQGRGFGRGWQQGSTTHVQQNQKQNTGQHKRQQSQK